MLRGEGGVTPLSGPEKILARSNALRTLDADSYPEIRFRAGEVAKSADGYRLTGLLEIHGRIANGSSICGRGPRSGMAHVVRGRRRQSEFAIKPYSMLMGSIKVADTVTVAATANGRGTDSRLEGRIASASTDSRDQQRRSPLAR